MEDEPTALASGAKWALVNLILMILTALTSIVLLVGYFGKKEEQDDDGNEVDIKRKGIARLCSLVPAIAAIIAFFLTEDMRNPMILVDRWTLLMVILAVLQVLVAVFARKQKEQRDDEQPQA